MWGEKNLSLVLLLATVSSSIHPSIYFFSFLPLELKIFIITEKTQKRGWREKFTMEIKNNVFTRLLFFIFLVLEQKAGIRNKNPSEWMNRMAKTENEMSRSSSCSMKCLFGDIIHQCELFSIFIILSLL